jgi:hypothetical protein
MMTGRMISRQPGVLGAEITRQSDVSSVTVAAMRKRLAALAWLIDTRNFVDESSAFHHRKGFRRL